jgi:hypothetical protein
MGVVRICRRLKGRVFLLSASKLKNLGGCLFLAGWVFLGSYAGQPFWAGRHVLNADPKMQTALLSTDLPGGSDFAFHQKSKTGDVPKLLPLSLDAAQGEVVVLIKNWNSQYDTRWSPGLMEMEDQRLTYASGERASARRTKSGNPTRTVLSIPWGGRYEERIYDLDPNKSYLLLLPQNTGWRGEIFSVEIRQGKTESHFYFVVIGFVSMIFGLLLIHSQRKSGLAALDQVKLARTYQKMGRTTEARDVLAWAMETHPNRSAEIRKILANMESLR